MISTVFCDLGNVVCFFESDRGASKLAAFLGRPTTEVQALLCGDRGTELLNRFERGAILPREYRLDLEELLGVDLPSSDFWVLHNNIFILNKPVRALLRRMQGMSPETQLVALTNTDRQRLVAMLALGDIWFDAVATSFDAGVMKPATGIFELALERAKNPNSEECLFIDDVVEYCDAARELGMHVHHYQSPELLEAELRRHDLIT